jgi:hypothetical protein
MARRAARKDTNHGAICEGLRDYGVVVLDRDDALKVRFEVVR